MAARELFSIAVFCALACAAQAEWQKGIATFTGVDDQASRSVPNGACGYGELSSEMYPSFPLAGMSFDSGLFKDKALKGCGTCVELKCVDEVCNDPNKVLTVMVYDTCDGCTSPTHVNLQALPFKSLAPLDIGRLAVQFREVPCRFNGGVVVKVDRFRASAGGWLRLLFKNVNGAPLSKVEFSPAGVEAWRPMTNNFGAAWEASRLPELPWDVKLTNADGQSIVLKSAVTSDKTGDFVSSNNFLPAGTGDAAPKEQPKQPETPVTQQPQQPEAPKQQPQQPETQKEEKKQETPKKEEEKPTAPQQDSPKADAPKADAPEADAPKADAPKADAPKADAPKADAPKADAPKADAPKADAAKADKDTPASPKADAPKADAADEQKKVDAPKLVAADEQQQKKDEKPAAVSPPVKAATTAAQPSKKPKGDLLAMLLQKDNIRA